MYLILGFVPNHVNEPAVIAAAPDVRLAFMKAANDAGTNPKGTLAPGLYLVATPIGNLEDITLRAVRVLKEADLIVCEDTRQTQELLNHYGITTRTSSYHEHNEMTRAAELVLELESGARVALVTDAGMPGISDPGFRLISLSIRHHVPVVPIPGASAFLAALVASGLPTDSFRFSGFLPPKSGQRRQLLESIKTSPRTQVFYEAPHRVTEAVEDIVEILGGERQLVIAREVTKMYEEFLRGRAREVLERLKARGDIKGEITLLIGKAEDTQLKVAAGVSLRQRLQLIMAQEKLDEKAALKRIAKEMGVSKSEAYRELQRSK
ncbi:MAG TPA: 16S rRNA (cytidine(1402)-2'-O)-methyltransferase [Terriglobales bacterium]|nr:16S rRNA (cytidine(1402)-2'-O)-methyltransferase [Terriglobales bacterium]